MKLKETKRIIAFLAVFTLIASAADALAFDGSTQRGHHLRPRQAKGPKPAVEHIELQVDELRLGHHQQPTAAGGHGLSPLARPPGEVDRFAQSNQTSRPSSRLAQPGVEVGPETE